MRWTTEAFGVSHEGIVGALLADGSEPKPVYLDFGSGGGSGCTTGEWWAYDGHLGRPKAVAYRSACACGWRGESFPIDWDQADEYGASTTSTPPARTTSGATTSARLTARPCPSPPSCPKSWNSWRISCSVSPNRHRWQH